ncbi:hypothetical protein [Mucilaginibacter sp. FT3.2]|uniref:hypothetical protein n=1 Tax=Mucilaginibacter sp. FT3.2 TaxID=2723090 RepID=UPI0016078EE5|nr:hypothetical protein [Mucilaginibacter sp. FT3.2]MBB6232102.1 hypothetical protein [Mucilaginibacter sp. FT3.2]
MTTHVKLLREFFWMMLLSGLLFCCGKASAQVLPEYSAFPSSSVGIQAGTQGLGLQGSYSFWTTFNARIGFNTVPGITVQYNSRDMQLNRTSVFAIADWQPMYGKTDWFARKWYISTGIAYYFSNNLYREGAGTTPNYTIYMSRVRPYIGTGLGNIHLFKNVGMRTDLGWFIPTSSATSTYDDKASNVSSGLRGLLPGLNSAVSIYVKF